MRQACPSAYIYGTTQLMNKCLLSISVFITLHSWDNHTYFTCSTFRVTVPSIWHNSFPWCSSIFLQLTATHLTPSQLCQYSWDIKLWFQMEYINHFLAKHAMFWVIKCDYYWFYGLWSQLLLHPTYLAY